MSDAISSILNQIRTYQTQAARIDGRGSSADPVRALDTRSNGFSDALKSAVNVVNEAQRESANLTKAFETGEPGIDLARVMIQSQEARVGFKALVEVRNRLVQAYQDVMSMPL